MTYGKNTLKATPLNSAKQSLIFDYICSWLISFGVLLAMRQLFRFENPTYLIIIRTTITLFFILLFTRKWWLLAGLGGFLLISVLLLNIVGLWDVFWEYATGIYGWWVIKFPVSSYYNTPFNVEVVQWLITITICALIFLMVRRIKYVSIIIAFVSILYISIILFGFRDNYFAVFFTLAGILPLIVQSQYSRIQQTFSFTSINARHILATGIIVSVLLSLVARVSVPYNTDTWKSQSLAKFLKLDTGNLEQPIQTDFSLETAGLQPNTYRLGGNIKLPHTPVLDVECDSKLLLKGSVYDTYDGDSWGKSKNYISHLFKTSDSDIFQHSFASNVFPSQEANLLLGDVSFPNYDADVTLLRGGYSLFYEGVINDLYLKNSNVKLYFNNQTEFFTRSVLPIRQQYSFNSTVFDKNSNILYGIIKEIESLAISGKINDLEYYKTLKENYTDLPDNVPEIVSNTALSFKKDGLSDYEVLNQMESWFKGNFSYTLTPGNVPKNTDIVEHFLKTKKGYCTYYATSMAVMARYLDIPAKFVVGYGLQQQDKYSQNQWRAYRDTAHSWVECYIRGVGWVTFDPTGGAGGGYFSRDPEQAVQQPTTQTIKEKNETQDTQKKSDTSQQSKTSEPKLDTDKNKTPLSTGIIILISATAFIMLALAIIILNALRKSNLYSIKNVKSKYPNNSQALNYYYTDILKIFSLLGLGAKTSETILQHSQRVNQQLSAQILQNQNKQKFDTQQMLSDINKLFDVVTLLRYANVSPTDQQLIDISNLHANLELYLKENINIFKFFFYRRFF